MEDIAASPAETKNLLHSMNQPLAMSRVRAANHAEGASTAAAANATTPTTTLPTTPTEDHVPKNGAHSSNKLPRQRRSEHLTKTMSQAKATTRGPETTQVEDHAHDLYQLSMMHRIAMTEQLPLPHHGAVARPSWDPHRVSEKGLPHTVAASGIANASRPSMADPFDEWKQNHKSQGDGEADGGGRANRIPTLVPAADRLPANTATQVRETNQSSDGSQARDEIRQDCCQANQARPTMGQPCRKLNEAVRESNQPRRQGVNHELSLDDNVPPCGSVRHVGYSSFAGFSSKRRVSHSTAQPEAATVGDHDDVDVPGAVAANSPDRPDDMRVAMPNACPLCVYGSRQLLSHGPRAVNGQEHEDAIAMAHRMDATLCGTVNDHELSRSIAKAFNRDQEWVAKAGGAPVFITAKQVYVHFQYHDARNTVRPLVNSLFDLSAAVNQLDRERAALMHMGAHAITKAAVAVTAAGSTPTQAAARRVDRAHKRACHKRLQQVNRALVHVLRLQTETHRAMQDQRRMILRVWSSDEDARIQARSSIGPVVRRRSASNRQ